MEFVLNEYHRNTSDEELIEDVKRVADLLKKESLSCKDYSSHGRFSYNTLRNRFGSWKGSIIAFKEYVQNRQGNIKIAKASPVTHKTSRTASKKLRAQIFERDQSTCQNCGANEETKPGVKLVLDHIVPYSKGGETTYENLQVLCRRCNINKNNKI